MSQHIFEGIDRYRRHIKVRMGYDRVLDYVFCTIEKDGRVAYSNLNDPEAGTEQQDIEYFRPILAKHGVKVPESMFKLVKLDQSGGRL